MRLAILLLPFVSSVGFAQTNELAFSLGGIPALSRSGLELGPGVALGINYGRRLVGGRKAALYGELEFAANPQRVVTGNSGATHDVATLYVTPGLRLKLLPNSIVSPFVAVGGGWARYEQSFTRVDGGPNAAPRELDRGAFDAAGGLDVRVWRFLGVRGEIRDFYTGSPAYNAPIAGGQNNLVATASLVLRWGGHE